ncbi:hypothetical protein DC28_00050 [Spirochaeta lutea]|uniref:Histidinol-phosphatase n=2 Tax=Spirochaeta lutea TaxID=1480694 RepID=A0A098R1L1_9SPIO|nr:hypothetical protein DC28_00050 [Spirochaeta lutea]
MRKESLLQFAQDIAKQAGDSTKSFFKTDLHISRKSDESPVTEADIHAEKLLRELISEHYPDHGIIGEEFEEKNPTDGCLFQWVVDPIDGTKSFIHGIPLYTTLIALLYDGKPSIGVIYNPILNELTSACVGVGAFYNQRRIAVSEEASLSKAWLQVTDPTDLLRRYPDSGAELISSVGFTRTWADGHGYALLARGEADIMIDPIVNLWDVACLHPIITEAGGRITDLSGNPGLGTSALAANPALHGKVLELFNKNEYYV